jgi:hypothetical protein
MTPMFGISFLSKVFGWFALLLIAIAIAIAQFVGGLTWVRRILWILAAIFAVVGAINEWASEK